MSSNTIGPRATPPSSFGMISQIASHVPTSDQPAESGTTMPSMPSSLLSARRSMTA